MFSSRPYTYYTTSCSLCIFPLLSKSPLGWLIEDKPQRANDIDTGLMFPVSDQVDKFLLVAKSAPIIGNKLVNCGKQFAHRDS